VSYLKDLPCAGCGTKSTYYFPDKPTAHYCYCCFRYEIGEQIARENESLAKLEKFKPIKMSILWHYRQYVEWRDEWLKRELG